MGTDSAAFATLPGDNTLPRAVAERRVALQAELLRAGACWEESLGLLREMATHSRRFPSAAEALDWYRAPYHPRL